MTFSYFKWWLKYRLAKVAIHRKWWWNDRRYDFKNLVYFINHGVTERDTWNIYNMLTTKFLKASYWLAQPKHGHGYPCSIEGSARVGAIDPTAYDEDADFSPYFLKWKEILHKMRFAHFYIQFIAEDEFSWMINNRKDRKNCFIWARKHYPYLKDFINWKFFLQMYTNESFKYESKMNFGEVDPETKTGELTFTDHLISTGEIVDIDIRVKYPNLRIAEERKADYEEGMELFKKYYLSLWD